MELQRRQVSQKRYFDRRARSTDLHLLHPGQHVRVQHPITGRWNPATVHAESNEPRSYILRNMNGKEFRRNRQHIRESCQLPHQSVEPPENAHATPTRLPTASTETELPNTVTPSVPPSESESESESEIHLFEPHSIVQNKYFNLISKTWIGRPLLRPSGRYRRGHQNYNINYY